MIFFTHILFPFFSQIRGPLEVVLLVLCFQAVFHYHLCLPTPTIYIFHCTSEKVSFLTQAKVYLSYPSLSSLWIFIISVILYSKQAPWELHTFTLSNACFHWLSLSYLYHMRPLVRYYRIHYLKILLFRTFLVFMVLAFQFIKQQSLGRKLVVGLKSRAMVMLMVDSELNFRIINVYVCFFLHHH